MLPAPTESKTTSCRFSYDSIDPALAERVRERVHAIRHRTAEATVAHGRDFLALKEMVGHGYFESLIQAEFPDINLRSVQRCIQCAKFVEMYPDRWNEIVSLPVSMIALLDARETPEHVTVAVLDRVAAGDRPTVTEVRAEIEAAKPIEAVKASEPDDTADDTIADLDLSDADTDEADADADAAPELTSAPPAPAKATSEPTATKSRKRGKETKAERLERLEREKWKREREEEERRAREELACEGKALGQELAQLLIASIPSVLTARIGALYARRYDQMMYDGTVAFEKEVIAHINDWIARIDEAAEDAAIAAEDADDEAIVYDVATDLERTEAAASPTDDLEELPLTDAA